MRLRAGGWHGGAAAAVVTALVAACGGGGDNPLGNPPDVLNPPGGSGQSLSFAYYQRCINPVMVAQLSLPGGGTGSCSSSGCHDNANGTGGAFRTVSTATAVDLTNPANTPDVVRQTEMYRNFYSAQGSTVIGAPSSSRLINKPLVQGTLHGGGLVFADTNDPNVRLLQYWISRPMPQGQDEFSSAAASMFTPADPETGTCNTQ